MKKHLFALFILTALLGACSHQKAATSTIVGEEENPVSNTLSFNTAEWKDSVVFTKQNMAKVAVKTVYADSEGFLADSINAWICEQLGDSAHTFQKDIPGLLRHMGGEQLKNDSAELKEILSDGAGEWVNYEYDSKGEVLYEDSLYITLKCETYQYMAGAHGSTIMSYVTLRRSDGRRMGWDLLKDMKKEDVIKTIKSGLMTYFEVKSTEELLDCLLLGNGEEEEAVRIFKEDFPLPATPPYLTADGVQIIYQQYEIAPYAAGMPSVCIKGVFY